MMTPVDVLLEAIQAASRLGDSPALRQQQVRKLEESIRQQAHASPGD